jgi:hypothetical protein
MGYRNGLSDRINGLPYLETIPFTDTLGTWYQVGYRAGWEYGGDTLNPNVTVTPEQNSNQESKILTH